MPKYPSKHGIKLKCTGYGDSKAHHDLISSTQVLMNDGLIQLGLGTNRKLVLYTTDFTLKQAWLVMSKTT